MTQILSQTAAITSVANSKILQIEPQGVLSLQTIAMPADTNWSGNIFGGWLVSQMDLAGAIHAERFSQGRCATIAIDNMNFLVPVRVGDVISCYTQLLHVGNSSMQIQVDVWDSRNHAQQLQRVTQGLFTFVALDANGDKRQIAAELKQAFQAALG